ncbi:MAG: DUF2807 domain-containing protein [Armatimonadetes bacterium]|nr:DUF2807 domain-containing protein [Armatimonadota bacterium]
MKPQRLLAILFMVAVLVGMVSLIFAMIGGAFYGVRSAVKELGSMDIDFSDGKGLPVAMGSNPLKSQIHGISVAGPIDVVWVRDSKTSFEVSGPADLVAKTKYEVEGDSLNLKVTSKHSHGTVKVTVHSADPSSLSIAGSGTITASGLKATSLSTSIAGSGDLTVSGKAKSVEASVAGSGDLHAYDLEADSVEINIAGSGSADIRPLTKLNVSIVGSGDVHYKGNPSIEKSVIGSGDLVRED